MIRARGPAAALEPWEDNDARRTRPTLFRRHTGPRADSGGLRLLPGPRPDRGRPHRPSHLRRGRRDGRRAGQRQEGRLHDHHHGRQRAQGRYSFPAGKLAPGQYALRIRAVGYDLDNSKSVEVAAQKTTTHDLKLRKTEDLAAQLSNGEWMASIPGTDREKGILLGCVGCHTLERAMRSPHDADTFMKVVLPRMQGYVNQSIPAHPQLRRGERRMEERGDQRVQVYRTAAEYLAKINLGADAQWKLRRSRRCRARAAAPPASSTPSTTWPRNDRAARRDRRCRRHRLVLELRRAEPRQARSQDRRGQGISDSRAQAGLPDRLARPARRQGRQPVARQHVPGHASSSSTARPRNSSSGRCRPSRTSTPRRSTW